MKEFTFCTKYDVSRLSKENLFSSNNAPEIHIFNSWRDQKWFLVANQLQYSTFFKKINSKDIDISKLVSQLKFLPSLFELKGNATVVMSTMFIIHVRTNDLPLNKTSHEIAEEIVNLAESVKKKKKTGQTL